MVCVLALLGLNACDGDQPSPIDKPIEPKEEVKVNVPEFDMDSAYSYVQQQVDFGPRVPETKEHAACADWLKKSFESFGWESQLQEADITGYNDQPLHIKNVIASFNPKQTKRVLLCAHWDTRRMADQDTSRMNEPILGADDGGSGVGVLMEIARVIGANNINIGIDIVLFDAEDQGESNSPRPSEQTWCLGAQYWSKNLHKMAAKPQFGILLDMVGFSHAHFSKEGVSADRAPAVQQAIWKQAQALGYSSLFVEQQTGDLIDDHVFVNDIAHIPTIDIINMSTNPTTRGRFGYYWHTHHDNMKIISKHTLNAVGKTLLQSLYLHEKDALF